LNWSRRFIPTKTISKTCETKPFQKHLNSNKSNLRSENPRVGSSILSQATIFIKEKRINRCAFCFWCVVGVSKVFCYDKNAKHPY